MSQDKTIPKAPKRAHAMRVEISATTPQYRAKRACKKLLKDSESERKLLEELKRKYTDA